MNKKEREFQNRLREQAAWFRWQATAARRAALYYLLSGYFVLAAKIIRYSVEFRFLAFKTRLRVASYDFNPMGRPEC